MAFMKKYICVMESIINYDSGDDVDIYKPQGVMYSSTIHLANLENIQKGF